MVAFVEFEKEGLRRREGEVGEEGEEDGGGDSGEGTLAGDGSSLLILDNLPEETH
jgi:hypothetical protein